MEFLQQASRFGHDPTSSQVDTIIFRSCLFFGHETGSYYGVDMSSSNNVKNLTLDDTTFFNMNYGVKYAGPDSTSSLLVHGCTFIQSYKADILFSSANISIIGTRSEGCGGSPATGGYFVTGTTLNAGGSNPRVLSIQNSYWAGYTPPNGYFIQYGGNLELRQNHFQELTGLRVPNIQVDYPGYDAVFTGGVSPTSILSYGNFYLNAKNENGKRVFYDFENTSLLDPTSHYVTDKTPIAFISDNDWGGHGDELIRLDFGRSHLKVNTRLLAPSLNLAPTPFANLGAPVNGTLMFCSDRVIANP